MIHIEYKMEPYVLHSESEFILMLLQCETGGEQVEGLTVAGRHTFFMW